MKDEQQHYHHHIYHHTPHETQRQFVHHIPILNSSHTNEFLDNPLVQESSYLADSMWNKPTIGENFPLIYKHNDSKSK
jgi:hypothetical protein